MSAKATVTVQITFELSDRHSYPDDCKSWEDCAQLDFDAMNFYSEMEHIMTVDRVEVEGADPWE